METMLRVRRDGQQFRAEIKGLWWNHWVYASSPSEALRQLHRHPDCAPWSPRIARALSDYNLGFGPVTDAHLALGISMATTLPQKS